MYAIFESQGKDNNGEVFKVYTNSYSSYRGNWIYADTNMFGDRCAKHYSPKPATWKTKEAAEHNAQKLIGYYNPTGPVIIKVHEIGPSDDQIMRAARTCGASVIDILAKVARGEAAQDEARVALAKICARAWKE